MAEIIKSYGLFWKAEDVFWGAGSNAGALPGRAANSRRSDPVDHRNQVGIYVLYEGHRMVYVGQAGSGRRYLFGRLRKHRRDHLAGRWDTFSWFGLRSILRSGELSRVNDRSRSPLSITLDQMEAILIYAAEPSLNLQHGKFGRGAKRYLQVRDERLGPTDRQMLYEVWQHLSDDSRRE